MPASVGQPRVGLHPETEDDEVGGNGALVRRDRSGLDAYDRLAAEDGDALLPHGRADQGPHVRVERGPSPPALRSTTVTSASRLMNASASSSPMYPPPTTTTCAAAPGLGLLEQHGRVLEGLHPVHLAAVDPGDRRPAGSGAGGDVQQIETQLVRPVLGQVADLDGAACRDRSPWPRARYARRCGTGPGTAGASGPPVRRATTRRRRARRGCRTPSSWSSAPFRGPRSRDRGCAGGRRRRRPCRPASPPMTTRRCDMQEA